MYYLLLPDLERRTRFIEQMRAHAIGAVFHYVPLHSAPMGQKLGRVCGSMSHTDSLSERLVRMPLWLGLEDEQARIIQEATNALA